MGQNVSVLVLDEEGSGGMRAAISDNFIKVRVPDMLAVNRWHQLPIFGLDEAGLVAQDSITTTAAEMV